MRILIIGSLQGHATIAAHIALKNGAKVTQTETADDGLAVLRSGKGIDIVLMDVLLNVPHMLQAMALERMCTPVVACGVDANPKLAREAIEAGAKEYLPLPPDPELIGAVLSAVSVQKSQVVAMDPAMLKVLSLADRIAPSEASVFISGESGTGKEVLAKYIHQQSKRSDKSFVSLNCAAIPENLLESELFGHEKGAFTGAVARRIGKFEEANGGTLLLDEISEMDPRLQAKLLRAIQERVIDRVGGTQPVPVNIRILATSNRDMMQAIQNGDFREDLYYRLNVVNLQIPALRERVQDIIPLANYFIDKFCEMNVLHKKRLSDQAAKAMVVYPWRGNVRELENMMHRAVLLSDTVIEPQDIFGHEYVEKIDTFAVTQASLDGATDGSNDSNIGRTVAEVEKDLILGTLNHCLGNRTHAANILGISIRTLRNKIKEYNSQLSQESMTAQY